MKIVETIKTVLKVVCEAVKKPVIKWEDVLTKKD